jgi:hypothetical protein
MENSVGITDVADASSISFGFDVLAGTMHNDGRAPSIFSVPEKALMFAVLVEAVETYQRLAFPKSRRKTRAFVEAERWFASRNTDYLFSFQNVCELLGFDPAFLRRGLSVWAAAEDRVDRPRSTVQLHAVRREGEFFGRPRTRALSNGPQAKGKSRNVQKLRGARCNGYANAAGH